MESEYNTAEYEKAKRKSVIKGVGTACIFTVLLRMIPTGGIPIDKYYVSAILCIVLALIMCLFNRKVLPEGWPVRSGQKCPVSSFLIAAGAFGLLHFGIDMLGGSAGPLDSTLPYAIYMGISIPIGEEIIFRGCVMERCKPYGYAFAIIGSSILFGLYHLNPVQMVTGFIFGLILGYMAQKYSIRYSVALHMINNLFLATLLPILSARVGNNYVKIGVEAAVALAGIIAFIKRRPTAEIREHLSKVRNEKKVYRYLFLNGWFIVIIAALIIVTVFLVNVISADPDLSYLKK